MIYSKSYPSKLVVKADSYLKENNMLRELVESYRVEEGQAPSKAIISLSPSEIEEAEKIATKLGGVFKYVPGKGRGGSIPVTQLLDMLNDEDEFDRETQRRIEAATKAALNPPVEPTPVEPPPIEPPPVEPTPVEPTPVEPTPVRRSVPPKRAAGA